MSQDKKLRKQKYRALIIKTEGFIIDIKGRGEEMIYSDNDLKLSLERTYCDGHRLYCTNTIRDDAGMLIPFEKRKNIFENLCAYFDTKNNSSIFVLDEIDKDRKELENFFTNLISGGHKITVEYDCAIKRENEKDEMYLKLLRAGKKLSINGEKIGTVEDYWRWKKSRI